MAKSVNWQTIAVVIALGFAWTKLGVGIAAKEIIPMIRPEYPPRSEIGHMTQAAWQAKYGGSQLDYEDWRKGV